MRRFQVAVIALVAAGGLVVQSCDRSSPTEAVAPVDSISVTPARVAIVKDQQATLVPTILDSTGAPVAGAKVTWESLSPDIVSVSGDGVITAKAYGPGLIAATVGAHSAQVVILVTAPPTTASYAVTELSPVPTLAPSRLTDSALVLAGNLVYRNGVGSAIPGCTPIDINNRSHVLCFDGKGSQATNYSLWSAGVFTPLAATDTFKATVFYPANYTGFPTAALNDSDVVLGGFYQPAFSTGGCPSGGRICIVYWKDGQPIFPRISASDVNWQGRLNNRLDFTVDCPTCGPGGSPSGASPFLYLAGTDSALPNSGGVNDINDVASMAIGGVRAAFATPQTRTTLGYGAATGINNANAVVGTLTGFGPFLWTGAGVSILTHAATDPSWTIVDAHKINNHGQILARADNTDGRKGVWLILTPVR